MVETEASRLPRETATTSNPNQQGAETTPDDVSEHGGDKGDDEERLS